MPMARAAPANILALDVWEYFVTLRNLIMVCMGNEILEVGTFLVGPARDCFAFGRRFSNQDDAGHVLHLLLIPWAASDGLGDECFTFVTHCRTG